jgi:hypothetical protein
MLPSEKAPGGASHYFMVLVPVVPKDTAKSGEIEKAWGDSWVARTGTHRAFIGKIRNADGVTYDQSLFVVDLPKEIDLATIDSGGPKRFPAPERHHHPPAHPRLGGWHRARRARRLAHRLLREGRLGPDADLCRARGRRRHGQGPREAPAAAHAFPRRHRAVPPLAPLRRHALCITAKNAIARIDLATRKATLLTPEDTAPERSRLVVSPDGEHIAFNKPVSMTDVHGAPLKSYDGKDFLQIFVMDVSTTD